THKAPSKRNLPRGSETEEGISSPFWLRCIASPSGAARNSSALIPEHHRLPAVNEHAVGQVPADTPRQGQPLAVAPVPQQIGGSMEVLHAEDLLVDDRSFVEIGRDVMARCPDQLHSSLVGALIGI